MTWQHSVASDHQSDGSTWKILISCGKPLCWKIGSQWKFGFNWMMKMTKVIIVCLSYNGTDCHHHSSHHHHTMVIIITINWQWHLANNWSGVGQMYDHHHHHYNDHYEHDSSLWCLVSDCWNLQFKDERRSQPTPVNNATHSPASAPSSSTSSAWLSSSTSLSWWFKSSPTYYPTPLS